MFGEWFRGLYQVGGRPLRRRLLFMYGFLGVLNLTAWGLAFAVFRGYPATLGLCLVAYGFGLRHAVDADHIAAIDNVTRKLMQQGQRPVAVGLFFSLGHSTVVLLMALLVALATSFMQSYFPHFRQVSAMIGTSVSAVFLLVIALMNFVVFLQVYQVFRAVRRGQPYSEDTLEDFLSSRGLIARVVRPLFQLVSRSWHLYLVGFLFGLGFDTASEVALLGIAASEAALAVPLWSIMVFPLLFTAGMSLVDATDGVVMLGAYGWAFLQPVRKLYYNLVITLVSFLIALFMGGVEVLGLVASRLGLDNGWWGYVDMLNNSSGVLGYGIISVLLVGWLAAVVIYKAARPEAPPAPVIGSREPPAARPSLMTVQPTLPRRQRTAAPRHPAAKGSWFLRNPWYYS